MPYAAGYWVDLESVKLDEETNQSWIQALPLGDYEHPIHGTISVTPERVARFVENVKTKARGQDLDIDYDHKERSGEAAGWVKDAADRGTDGLWLLVEWTKDAAQKIKNKAYRYFSPEFVDEWEHPKTKTVFKDVLFGGGITNRPFLKDILPINMTEVFEYASPHKSNEGGSTVTPEQIKAAAKKLGLAEDATEDQVYEAIEGLEFDDSEQEEQQPAIAATEVPADIIKLAESSPGMKQFIEAFQGVQKQLGETTVALQLAENTNRITKLAELAKSKGYALPPAVQEEMVKALTETSGNKQLSDVVFKSFEATLEAQLKQLGEKGHLRPVPNEDDEKSAAIQLNEKVVKLRETNKDLDYAGAVASIAATDPELYDRYRSETYANQRREA